MPDPNEEQIHMYERLRSIESRIGELKEDRADLIAQLQALGNTEYEHEGMRVGVAVVRRSRPVVNLLKLQTLDPHMYERITKQVLDSEKFGQTLDEKIWDPDVLSQTVTITEDRPFLRFSEYHSTQESNEHPA